MCLDYICNFILNNFKSDSSEERSDFFISKNIIHADNSSTLKVILPPWGDQESFATKILLQRLHKLGCSTVTYRIPQHILSVNTDHTLRFFITLKEQVKRDIQELKTTYHFSTVDIIAPSLGVVSACLIANGNDDISNLYFIVPGSCLASSLWNGIRTKHLRIIYEQQGLNEEQLIKKWSQLAPKNNISRMQGKRIFIAISKADKIIPYRFGKELADLIQTMYPDNSTVVENTHRGHYLTVVKYYLFDNALL